MKAEDIEGYRGKEDIDAILSFIEAEVRTQSLGTVNLIMNKNQKWNGNSNGTSKWEFKWEFKWDIQIGQPNGT